MTTHRRYFFLHERPWPPDGRELVGQVLITACERYWWFSQPVVSDRAFSFEVAARDQWWCHRRAMKLADQCCLQVFLGVPEPVWETLPPHANRGRYRVSPATAPGAG